MSISAFISNPIDQKERSFYLPISSEIFFNSHWQVGCRQLDLYWIPCFSNGIEIYKEDIPEVIMEINQLKIWAIKNLKGRNLDYITNRIDLFNTHIPIIFTRNDVSVFIG